MKKIRITVMRVARCCDLIEQYENPSSHAFHFLAEALDGEAGA